MTGKRSMATCRPPVVVSDEWIIDRRVALKKVADYGNSNFPPPN
jgi:hypothetical protein